MKKLLIVLSALLLALIGCAKVNSELPFQPSVFTKGAYFPEAHGESSPFVFNGELLLMVTTMTSWTSSNAGTVAIYRGDQQISKINTEMSLGSVLVDSGTVYIFGSKHWDKNQNGFYMISSTDLITWTPELKVIDSPEGIVYYNQSVAKVGSKFVMTYEYCTNSATCQGFNIKFKESTDLINWSEVGEAFSKGPYVGCPTLKYHNGEYLLFYGIQIAGRAPACETMVAKSTDLINWNRSNDFIVTPRDKNDSGICDSDFDLEEFGGQVHAIYIEGNQKTWFTSRFATFNGTMSDLVNTIKWEN